MTWTVPAMPDPLPSAALGVREISGAVLTRYEQGPLRLPDGQRPLQYCRGAVYADGGLVPESQRLGVVRGDLVVAVDPLQQPETPDDRLPGRWLYLGHWHAQFGHFLLETLVNLWPREDVDGVVAHTFRSGPQVRPWQAELVEMTGFRGEVRVVADECLEVETLLLAPRATTINAWAYPEAVDVWRRVAAAVEPAGERRVYLSRTAHNRTLARRRTSEEVDLALDAAFAERGFAVVAPETLGVREQVALMAGAEVVAGTSGSALHLTAFAPEGCHVLEVADSRTVDRQHPAQQLIDAATGHPTAVAPWSDDPQVLLAGVDERLAELPAPPTAGGVLGRLLRRR